MDNHMMSSISETWGTTSQERELVYPCDFLIARPEAALYRGVTIDAPAEIVFRWLCQMRVAPYSYDWIDNLGRRSPRDLTPGLEKLAIGQDVMGIFDLIDFKRNRQITIRVKPGSGASRKFGDVAVTYLIVPASANSSRLLVKLIANYPRGAKGRLMAMLLPWGDLIMMRRQLLNLKQLAERQRGLDEDRDRLRATV